MTKLSKKKIVIAVCLLVTITLTFIAIYYSINSSSGYTLVGDTYVVNVTKKQFDQFGRGQFADLDLDKFVEYYKLKKIYFDDPDTARAEGYIFTATPSQEASEN